MKKDVIMALVSMFVWFALAVVAGAAMNEKNYEAALVCGTVSLGMAALCSAFFVLVGMRNIINERFRQ